MLTLSAIFMDRTNLQTISNLGRNVMGLWADIKIATGKRGFN
jgi:hypothetical protein